MTKREIAYFLLVLSLMVPLAWRWLYFKGEVPVNGNVVREVYPNWQLTHTFLREGHWPLWNPYKNMGEPYLADPKSMAAYPISWILSGMDHFSGFLKAWYFFHTLLAALFAGALAFRWFGSRPAAAMGAILAGFNGFFMAHGPYLNLFASAAWLPAIWYFQSKKSWQGMGVCLAFQWLAGYPPFSLLTILSVGVLFWGLKEGSWTCLWRAALAALILAAYQWMPFVEYLTHATRGLFLDPHLVLQFSVAPADLMKELFLAQWSWIKPEILGDPAVVSFYFGGLAIPLGAWAVWRGGRRERVLTLVIVMALLLTLGSRLPGYQRFLPLHAFRFPATWLYLAAGFMALWVAAGISKIKDVRVGWTLVGLMAFDLLLFAQQPTAAWFEPAYLENPSPLTWEMMQQRQPSRLYVAPAVDAAWLHADLKSLEDYLFMKRWPVSSSAAGWKVREANSYQVLRLRPAQAYLDRLASEGPQSRLLPEAGISKVITLRRPSERVSDRDLVALDIANPKPLLYFADHSSVGRVLNAALKPGRVRATVDLLKPGLLVFAEVDYPGWGVRIDGIRAKPARFENTFLAVEMAAGTHEVVWDYQPASFAAGGMITLLGLFGMVWTSRIRTALLARLNERG